MIAPARWDAGRVNASHAVATPNAEIMKYATLPENAFLQPPAVAPIVNASVGKYAFQVRVKIALPRRNAMQIKSAIALEDVKTAQVEVEVQQAPELH